MTKQHDSDALDSKKRFVRSLTGCDHYITSEDFLTPIESPQDSSSSSQENADKAKPSKNTESCSCDKPTYY